MYNWKRIESVTYQQFRSSVGSCCDIRNIISARWPQNLGTFKWANQLNDPTFHSLQSWEYCRVGILILKLTKFHRFGIAREHSRSWDLYDRFVANVNVPNQEQFALQRIVWFPKCELALRSWDAPIRFPNKVEEPGSIQNEFTNESLSTIQIDFPWSRVE